MTDTQRPAERPELRSVFTAELREANLEPSGNGKDIVFSGSPIVFNTWSEPLWTPLGTFRERVLPGALDDVLPTADVELNYNHNSDSIMARTSSGTLDITTDADETRVWSRLDPRDPDVQRLQPKMERGDIKWMSFAFEMDEEGGAEDRWYEDDDGEIRRDIVKVSDLFDVSIVGRPAYTATSAELRSLTAAAEHGQINLAARAETDPAGETPPVGDGSEDAPAGTDPVVEETDPIAEAAARRRESLREARESYLRLCKELSKR